MFFCDSITERPFGTLSNIWCWWRWWIVFVIWFTDERRLALLPAKIIVKDPHYRESLTCLEQDLNLHSSGFIKWSCVVAGHIPIVACMRLPLFKIFSDVVHFCPNFQIFCPILPFSALFLKNRMHTLTF